MSELLQHLKYDQFSDLFIGEHYTNALRFLYTALLSAVDDRAEKFIIKRNGFEWYQGMDKIGQYLGGNVPAPTPSYDQHFQRILLRDEIVKRHTKILYVTPEETIIEINV
jgi:hypothetical protein